MLRGSCQGMEIESSRGRRGRGLVHCSGFKTTYLPLMTTNLSWLVHSDICTGLQLQYLSIVPYFLTVSLTFFRSIYIVRIYHNYTPYFNQVFSSLSGLKRLLRSLISESILQEFGGKRGSDVPNPREWTQLMDADLVLAGTITVTVSFLPCYQYCIMLMFSSTSISHGQYSVNTHPRT